MACAILDTTSVFDFYVKKRFKVFEACYSTQLLPLYLDLPLAVFGAGQDTMVYKIMLSKWFCSLVNLKPAFVVLDLSVPCHQQNCCGVWVGAVLQDPPLYQ